MREVTLTHADLRRVLEQRRGARIVTIVTVTVPKMRKTDNPFFGLVECVVRRNGMCGASYENSVNRRRTKEETPRDDQGLVMEFTSRPLPWGEHDGPFFVKHTGKDGIERRYLKFLPNRNLEEQYRHPVTKHEYDAAAVQQIKAFMPVRKPSTRQEVENQVDWRTIALDSIHTIKIDGELYAVANPVPELAAA